MPPVLESVHVLSPMQQGLLFHSLLAPEAGLYVDQTVLDLEGEVDAEALAGALRYALDRHPALRTGFHWQDLDQPLQTVHGGVEAPLHFEDWRAGGNGPERLEAWLTADRRRGFDLAQPPLLRFTLIRTGERRSLLISTFHHILLDGWSSAVLLEDLLHAYGELRRGRSPQGGPVRPFTDYLEWLQRQDAAQAGNAEAFWRARLQSFAEPTPLDGFGSNGFLKAHAPGAPDHDEAAAGLDPGRTADLRAFAGRHGLTLNTLVQGAWALLLRRGSGEADVVFGATVAGRPESLPGVGSMVGLFINTLPVRATFRPGEGLVPWLRRLQAEQVEARPYEHSPLAEIQRWSGVPAGRPLFESIVAFENTPDARAEGDARPPLEVRGSRYISRTHYPLSLLVRPGTALTLQITYDRRRFAAPAVARLLEDLAGLLDAFLAEPAGPAEDLILPGETERHQLLHEWPARPGQVEEATGGTLHAAFAEQARRSPGQTAVDAGEAGSLTYGELHRRAAQLARHLRSLGVGPEVPVVTSVERSPDSLVALFGVLQAGGVYVPVEPATPAERLDFVLRDTGAPVLLTGGGRYPETAARQVRIPDGIPAPDTGQPAADGFHPPPESLAYAIYTSGSTGRPKAVGVPHGAAAAHMAVAADLYGIAPGERVVQFTSHAFDAALEQVFTALGRGATLVLRGEEAWDTGDLSARLRRERADTANFPTPFWARWTEEIEDETAAVPSLRLMIAGGEAMSGEALARWQASPLAGVRLLNAYGPTEGLVTAAFFDVPPGFQASSGAAVPIGRALPGRVAYVLDRRLAPVPAGAPGELCLGGPLLARGYLGRPDLTAAAFVPDPFGDLRGTPGARLYRTGDRARFRPDGTLEFLGRLDRQVKVRGFRVEPGEVEAALHRHPAVREAAVELRPDLPGGAGLVAYVGRDGTGVSGPELRAFLQEVLPAPLVPSRFAVLDTLPRTPGDKVDRRALAALPLDRLEGEDDSGAAAPRTPVEELLAGAWEALLGLERAGVHDDFFALGGHSLLATRLLSRIREAFQVELPLAALFDAPTIAGQAERIAAALKAGETEPIPATPPPLVSAAPPEARTSTPFPLSFAQQRLWILDQFDPGVPAYNMPLAIRLRGPLSPPGLQAALTAVVARHESLRTRFEGRPEGPVQHVAPAPDAAAPVPLAATDLSALPEAEREAALLRLAREEAGTLFDLARGPLLRAGLVHLGPEDHALLLTVHHTVADGGSIGILLRDLTALYQGLPLPALPVQYPDFAVWQRGWLQGEVLEHQIAFWRAKLAGAPTGQEIPTDAIRPALMTSNGAVVRVRLGPELSAAVRGLARDERATPFMALLAAFQELLGRYTGRQDPTIGTPMAHRDRREIEDLVGFFVNTLVLRADLSGEPTGRDLVARAREGVLAAHAHGEVPFEKLVEELQPERSLSLHPFFQVVFTFETPPPLPGLRGVEAEYLVLGGDTAKFDLTLGLADAGDTVDGIAGVLEYNTDLFEPATAERIVRHFTSLAAGLAAAPEAPAADLPMLGDEERGQLLREWDASRQPLGETAAGTLHALVARQAARTPGAVAVSVSRDDLTYAELNRRSNQLAHLLRGLGVRPEVPVGLFLERTLELPVAILGILKAGGAYIPLDPAYPEERLALTLEDCHAPVVVTQEWLVDRLPHRPGSAFRTVFLDASWEALDGQPEEPPADLSGPWNLAYMIYTSGSTGRPKGIAIEHRSAAALVEWAHAAFSQEEMAVVLGSTSVCFDISVFELFATWTRGGRLLLVESALDLLSLGPRAGVTLLNTVPSAAAELARAGGIPPSVRTVNLAGEAIPLPLVDELEKYPAVERAWNLYGPSECTTYSTVGRVLPRDPREKQARRPRQPPAIGRPIAGTSAVLLDEQLRPVPVGVPGELYLGGAGLARGYFNRPERTAAGFVPHPFSDRSGERLYRTGDRVRARPDGELEFLGRFDHQVKVRGFRIELSEVETALAHHPAVAEAVALAREDRPGERRLVGYVLPKAGAPEITPASLRQELQKTLPEFMLPTLFVTLPSFPRTASGKVDRGALPMPENVRAAVEFSEPESELERAVAEAVAGALQVEKVGRHDNFFDLGGHSLSMIRAAGLLEERLGRKVQVLEMFRFSTVASLAAHLVDTAAAPGGPEADPAVAAAEFAPSEPGSHGAHAANIEARRQVQGRRRDLRRGLRAADTADNDEASDIPVSGR